MWGQKGSHRTRFPLSTVMVRWSTPALSRVLILEEEGERGGSEGCEPWWAQASLPLGQQCSTDWAWTSTEPSLLLLLVGYLLPQQQQQQ